MRGQRRVETNGENKLTKARDGSGDEAIQPNDESRSSQKPIIFLACEVLRSLTHAHLNHPRPAPLTADVIRSESI